MLATPSKHAKLISFIMYTGLMKRNVLLPVYSGMPIVKVYLHTFRTSLEISKYIQFKFLFIYLLVFLHLEKFYIES